MIYFFNCCYILWNITKFIWQRKHISPKFIEISMPSSGIPLGKMRWKSINFHLVIISQDWEHPFQLCQGDHQGLDNDPYFVTLSITMAQPLSCLPRQWNFPCHLKIWHSSCLLFSGVLFFSIQPWITLHNLEIFLL